VSGEAKVKALPVGAPWEVGQVREVPFHLSANDLIVECLVIDERSVFGRTEYQITPVAGHESAWVQPSGPKVGGKAWQGRHK